MPKRTPIIIIPPLTPQISTTIPITYAIPKAIPFDYLIGHLYIRKIWGFVIAVGSRNYLLTNPNVGW